jgi:hypothetical protein
MNKHINARLRRSNAGIILFSILITIVGTNALAQTAKTVAKPDDVWVTSYTVTIKGEGTEEPELGSDNPVITWKVDRTYTGTATLKFKESTLSDADEYAKYSEEAARLRGFSRVYDKVRIGREKHTYHGGSLPRVIINDLIRREGDPTCAEYDVTDETWRLDIDRASDGANVQKLIVNNWGPSHNINFPVRYAPITTAKNKGSINTGMPVDVPVSLMYTKTTTHFPTKVTKVEQSEPRPHAINLSVPYVKGWLERSGVILRNDIPLPMEEGGSYSFESGEIIINETVLEGVNTAGKVSVHVFYVIRKVSN